MGMIFVACWYNPPKPHVHNDQVSHIGGHALNGSLYASQPVRCVWKQCLDLGISPLKMLTQVNIIS